jgi:hypothetical protein
MDEDEFNRFIGFVKDPKNLLCGMELPVVTTMIYKICERDFAKFDELMRLCKIITEEAMKLPKKEITHG